MALPSSSKVSGSSVSKP